MIMATRATLPDVSRSRERLIYPWLAYQVSGEFSRIDAAARWLG